MKSRSDIPLALLRAVLATCAVAFATQSFGATYEFQNRNRDNDYLGATTWKTNNGVNVVSPPRPGDGVYVTSGTGHDTVVSVTNDVSVDYRFLVFKAQPSSSFKFFTCGDAHTFEMPYVDGGKYVAGGSGSSWALGFQNGDGQAYAKIYSRSANGPCFSWTDPEFTLSSADDGYPTLAVSRGTFDFRAPGGYDASTNIYNQSSYAGTVLFGTNVTVILPKVQIDHANANLLFRGSKLTNCGELTLSQKYLEFSDGATAELSNLNVYSASTPQMVVSNATVTVKGDVAVGSSSDGKLIVQDGGNVKVNGSNAIQVAAGAGDGGVEVHGGSLTTTRIRLSRGGAAAGKTAYLLQTGGTITLTGNGIQFQQSCTGNNIGTHYVQLDGGVLKASSIFRDATVTAGTVYLSGDGGTFQACAAGTVANRLSYAECGEKGLAVDTAGYNCTFAVPVQDKSGASGQFIKKGAGTLTMSRPSDYTVSRTVAAGGTLNFSSDLDAHTDLVVTNGGAFSLAGTATKATVDALVVTNGVFVLDPGDSIEVEGALDVSNLRINWTSLPSSAQAFLVVKGELSDSQKREIKRVYCENALADGKRSTISVSYDDATQTTIVTTTIEDDEPLTDSAAWTGSGAWSAPANWENGVKPDATKTAVFGAGAAGFDVTVADGDVAGALSFTGGGYRILGSGVLAVDGVGCQAKIGVSAGSHSIASSVDLMSQTTVDVASGAELALDGCIANGGLVKTGLGRLVLGGTMDTFTGFSSLDGIVTVTNETALGSNSEDAATIVAGTLEFKHPAGDPMSIDATVALAGAASRTSLVYKVDTDVTLNNIGEHFGGVYKRGAGTLTIDVPADTTRTFSTSNPSADTTDANVVFPADGSAPSGTWAPLCIAEGEMRFVGHGNSKVTLAGAIKVGVPVESSAAQAELTVDGIYLDASGSIPYFGYCATSAKNNMHPVIRVVNGGVLHCSGAQPAYACMEDGTTVVFALTNGTYRLNNTTYSWLSRGRVNSGTHVFVRYLMNASRMEVNVGTMNGSILVDADNGSYFGGKDGEPASLLWSNADRIYGEMLFRNGSTFAISNITEVSGQNRNLTIAFDDAEWLYDAAHGDKSWPASATGRILYEMRGKGVILKPASGRTFTTLAPFGGAGGLVVDGEGTVAFGANTAKFTGTLDVRQGAADFSGNGAQAAFTGVKGAGTVSGATMGAMRMYATLLDDGSVEAVPAFADCAFTDNVTVDFGRTPETAFAKPYPSNLLVARYSGTTAPDAANWRMAGTGVSGCRGVFTAANGEVRMSVVPTGCVVIVK